MKVLQANTDSAAMCTALLDLLAEDPEAARYPFFENSMEPPLCCAAKAFCSAEATDTYGDRTTARMSSSGVHHQQQDPEIIHCMLPSPSHGRHRDE
eukprot:g26831.t1